MPIHVLLFFHKDETTTHLPHDIQQSMRYSYVQSHKPAVTGHSNSQYRDQYSKWRHKATFWGQWTSYHVLHVFLCIRKRLSTLNFTFHKVNYFPCRKQPVGESVINWNGLMVKYRVHCLKQIKYVQSRSETLSRCVFNCVAVFEPL